ncbi:keratin-associated protein 19-3-like [Struthio camelus]|uniref:keratin-associated protein 19-3-like n=1 Tax=Struthio camelus TaxID=8801 RepID=UPI003604270D
MTFFQGQCEDDCYSPCSYGSLYGNGGYNCGSPCGYRGSGGLYSSRGLYGFGDCYGYGGLCGYRGFYGSGDCYGYGGLYGGNRGFYGSGDCYGYGGLYSGRCSYPLSSRFGQRYSYGNCYPC